MTIYLDNNATTPLEPEVLEVVLHYLREEFGNAGSRTHEFGARAKQAVEQARGIVAQALSANRDEVFFTSGATESNNLALLGLRQHAEKTGKRHIVTSMIEHKAVLEPLEFLESQGFTISRIAPGEDGRVKASDILAAVTPETLLVSVMHANNETGVIQPVEEIAKGLPGDVFFHVDAAQTFGKLIAPLQNPRIDLISISAHKIFGPKGIGVLLARRRDFKRPPLTPLMFGGGQERGLRPGTLPVHLIAGLGKATEIALRDHGKRAALCEAYRRGVMDLVDRLQGVVNGDTEHMLPHVLNVSLPGIDSEAAIVALKGEVAISNGSACTSTSYSASHVLVAMGLGHDRIESALRLSWSHLTPPLGADRIEHQIRMLR